MSYLQTNAAELTRFLATLDISQAAAAAAGVDPEQLVNSLDGLSVSGQGSSNPHVLRTVGEKSQHHEIHLEYPSFELIPWNEGGILILFEPKNRILRERPQLHKFHLELDNMYFVARVQTPLPVSASTAPTYHRCDSLLEQMQRLSQATGVSTLKIASYSINGNIMFRTQLITNWVTAKGFSAREVQDFTCHKATWDSIMSVSPNEQWVRFANQLILRACDRSFLIVREKIRSHHKATVEEDEARFEAKWNSYGIDTAFDLLFARFQKLGKKRVGGPFGNGLQEVVRFPCRHEMVIPPNLSRKLISDEDCKKFCCPLCGARVLEQRHLERLDLIQGIQERHEWLAQDKEWEETLKATDYTKTFDVFNRDVKHKLDDVLKKLKMPESVMPSDLDCANAPETTAFLSEIFKVIGDGENKMTVSVESFITLMLSRVVLTLTEALGLEEKQLKMALPPKYSRFLIRWFARTALELAASIKEEKAKLSALPDCMEGVQL